MVELDQPCVLRTTSYGRQIALWDRLQYVKALP